MVVRALEDDIYNIKLMERKDISLDEENLVLMQSVFKPRKIRSEMYFLKAGDDSREMAMVTKGLFRSYYIDENGNDITKYFYPEGSMLFSYMAYMTHTKSMYSIQALEDSEILTASISEFEKVMNGNYQLLLYYKKILDEILIKKEEHASSFKLYSSTERYKLFLDQYPGLEKRVKQYQLASYLGITPVSLSRIRNKLNLNK